MHGIDDGHDGIERVVRSDVVVDEEGLRHRRRVGQAGGLDDDAVKRIRPCLTTLAQLAEDANQVAAHGAADATVVHLDDLLVATGKQQLVVHARFAELVLDHRDSLAVTFAQDAFQKRRLAGTEEPGEDGHRNLARNGGRKHSHFNRWVDPTDWIAKRFARSCSFEVMPLSINSVSAALSHCS